MRFLILLVVFVYIELSLAAWVVDHIGLLNTIGLMLLSAFLGVFLIRRQGFVALEKIRLNLAEGKTPADNIIDGLCLIFAGFLFIFPGFFSDILGFLLLLPWARRAVTAFLKPRLGTSGTWFSRTVIYTRDGGWQSSETWSGPVPSSKNSIRDKDGKTFDSRPGQVIIDCTPEDSQGTARSGGSDKSSGKSSDDGSGNDHAQPAYNCSDKSSAGTFDVPAEPAGTAAAGAGEEGKGLGPNADPGADPYAEQGAKPNTDHKSKK